MWLQTVVYGPLIIPSHNNNTIPGIIMGDRDEDYDKHCNLDSRYSG